MPEAAAEYQAVLSRNPKVGDEPGARVQRGDLAPVELGEAKAVLASGVAAEAIHDVRRSG